MKSSILRGTLILTIAGLLTRFIGFFYRIYLAKLLGTTELGLYQLILPVYAICFTIYGSSLQTATSQLISQHSKKEHASILRGSLCLSLAFALSLTIFVYFEANIISNYYLQETLTAPLLKILALLFPFCGVSAIINGYFYGLNHSKVPAYSQIIEQIARVSFVFTLSLLPLWKNSYTSLAVLGIVVGEFTACIYNIFKLRKLIPITTIVHHSTVVKPILKYSLPLTGCRISITLLNSFEAILIPIALYRYGFNKSEALALFGVLTGIVMPFIMFPGALTNSLSVLLLPSIAKSSHNHSNQLLFYQSKQAIRYSIILGLFATAFFVNYGETLCTLIFHNNSSGKLLTLLSLCCPFIYTSSTIQTIINGLGKTTITLLIHLFCIILRVLGLIFITPAFGIIGYILSMFISNLLFFLLGEFYLMKQGIPVRIGSYLLWTDFFFGICILYIAKIAGNYLVQCTNLAPAIFIPVLPAGIIIYFFLFISHQIESPKVLLQKL